MSQALQLAHEWLNQNKLKEAYAAFTAILNQQPQLPEAHFGLGKVLVRIDELDSAVKHLSISCQTMPDNLYPLLLLADTFQLLNSHQDAASIYQHILSRHINNPQAHYHYAVYCSEYADRNNTVKHAKKCISLLSDSSAQGTQNKASQISLEHAQMSLLAHAWLLLVKTSDKSDYWDAVKELQRLKQQSLHWADIVMIFEYALGNLYDKQQEYQRAFLCWQRANAIQFKACTYKVSDIEELFDQIKNQKWPNPSQQKGSYADPTMGITPIFIVGLARTGSTLIEQVLCQHELVDTLGEQAIISDHVAAYFSHKYAKPYPAFISDLSDDDYVEGARIYCKALSKRQLSSPYVVDKLPANFQSIGLIKMIFPDAKIIHSRRAFDDLALSTFQHYFAENEAYFCDIKSIHAYHTLQVNLMEFWQHQCHLDYFVVDHELFVQEHDKTLSRLLEYCGLSHADMSSTEQENKNKSITKPVKTLSALQVKQPINTLGIGKANPYRELLANVGLTSDES